MKTLLATIPLALALAATACGGDDPVDGDANDTAGLNEVIQAANETAAAANEASEIGAAPALNEAGNGPPPRAGSLSFPDRFHGRWGMVPGDCQSGRADAKGLIFIGERTVRLYESIATLKEPRPSTDPSFSGLFAFTGEGQNWEKVMTFTRAGNRLTRVEEEGRFTYVRCA